MKLGKTLDQEKQSKPSRYDEKFRNYPYDLAQDIFNDSLSRDQELAGLHYYESLIFFCNTFFKRAPP